MGAPIAGADLFVYVSAPTYLALVAFAPSSAV